MLIVTYSDEGDFLVDLLANAESAQDAVLRLTTVYLGPTSADPIPIAWVEAGYLINDTIYRLTVTLGCVLGGGLSDEQARKRVQLYGKVTSRAEELEIPIGRGRLRWALEVARKA